MIKECPVLLNNDAVTVVRFDDIDVQLPSIHCKAKTVRVSNENGRYFVVNEDRPETDKIDDVKPKRVKNIKKTTAQEEVVTDEAY